MEPWDDGQGSKKRRYEENTGHEDELGRLRADNRRLQAELSAMNVRLDGLMRLLEQQHRADGAAPVAPNPVSTSIPVPGLSLEQTTDREG
eukprot:3275833-Amphidinium_carterae.1